MRKHTVRKQTRKNRKVRGGGSPSSPSRESRSKSKSQMKKILIAKEWGFSSYSQLEEAEKNAGKMGYKSYFELRKKFEDALEKLENSGKSLEKLGLNDDILDRAKKSIKLQEEYHIKMVHLIITTAEKLVKNNKEKN